MGRVGLRLATARTTAFAACLSFAAAVYAHTGGHDSGYAPMSLPWAFEPWETSLLGVSALLYGSGLRRLWRRAGLGRGVAPWQVLAFGAGWVILVIALLSPLDALCNALFSAHMVQHELLMIVAAPLFVMSRPLSAWLWAFPAAWRVAIGKLFHQPGWRRPWLLITAPLCAWTLHALALWLWHLPALFEAALHNEVLHALQHLFFLGTALVFWWSLLRSDTRRVRGIALLSLFATFVHTGALGALLTLSQRVWYPSYALSASQYGLNALQDQQLGGVVMWVPTGFVYLLAALVLSTRWLRESPVALPATAYEDTSPKAASPASLNSAHAAGTRFA